jgi:hypothetical protein
MSQDDVDTPVSEPVEPESGEPETTEVDPVATEETSSDMPAADAEVSDAGAAAPIECPPAAEQPERAAEPDPRARLNQLAMQLVRNRSRRLLIEFLQLRRALRV